jgi:putative membrane protein insertion efficiency factor
MAAPLPPSPDAAARPRGWRALPQRLLIGVVRGYRLLLSPWLGSACRFEPTCSAYALEALQRHGAAAGAYMTTARLLRCHPWCAGGHDPVPAQPPRLFSRLLRTPPATATQAPSSADSLPTRNSP